MASVLGDARRVSSLDPFSAEFRADPYRHYATLRSLGPLVWLERYGIWVVSHYAQVRAVLGDHARFGNAGGGGLTNLFHEENWRPRSIILEVDPPQHTRTREVLSRVLNARALMAMQEGFASFAEQLVDGAVAQRRIEAVAELVQPYPLTVFANAVGMPPLDREIMLVYGTMVFGAFGPRTPWYDALMARGGEVARWIDARCERAALTPDGLGSAIYAAADAGDVSEEEAKLLVRSLLSAGVDTTIDSIGLCLRALAERPDQWAMLHDDPGLARNAFEEATRYDSSSQSVFRNTTAAFAFEGQQLAKHEKVLVLIGSAGRDPARWDEPDRFDIRRRITHQIGYGAGIHGCVAQMMVRLEAEMFFRAMARNVCRIEATGPASQRLTPGLRGLATLPLELTSAQ